MKIAIDMEHYYRVQALEKEHLYRKALVDKALAEAKIAAMELDQVRTSILAKHVGPGVFEVVNSYIDGDLWILEMSESTSSKAE